MKEKEKEDEKLKMKKEVQQIQEMNEASELVIEKMKPQNEKLCLRCKKMEKDVSLRAKLLSMWQTQKLSGKIRRRKFFHHHWKGGNYLL